MEKIGYCGGLSVNLEQIKCIKQVGNKLVIEYRRRLVYVLNPFTEEYEIREINDEVVMEYSDYENAHDYKHEFDRMWEDFVAENGTEKM